MKLRTRLVQSRGRIQNSIGGNFVPVASGHVWIEDLESGKVMAGSLTNAGGRFSIGGVPDGKLSRAA